MSDESVKKRLKSTDSQETTSTILLSISDHDEDDEPTQVDQQIEQEEKTGDNLVIRDLMGSVRPESQKVSDRTSNLVPRQLCGFVLETQRRRTPCHVRQCLFETVGSSRTMPEICLSSEQQSETIHR